MVMMLTLLGLAGGLILLCFALFSRIKTMQYISLDVQVLTSMWMEPYQVSKSEIEFHMMNIIYAALHMHTHAEKSTLSCTDG